MHEAVKGMWYAKYIGCLFLNTIDIIDYVHVVYNISVNTYNGTETQSTTDYGPYHSTCNLPHLAIILDGTRLVYVHFSS